MENMINLTIDGVQVQVPQGTTVLEAARQAGIRIPTLCFLKDINEIGACRMCVVDSGARSLQAACVLPAADGMVVKTNTPQIRKYRKNILKLTLSTHQKKCLSCIRSQNCELQKLCLELGVEDGDDYEAGARTSTPSTTCPPPSSATTTSACCAAAASPSARRCRTWASSARSTAASRPPSSPPGR